MWVLSVTLALGECGIEGKARRTTFAFLSVVVVMSVLGAALTFLGCLIPELRLITFDACRIFSQDRLVFGADTMPGGVVKDEVSRAGQALLGVCSPLSRGRTVHAEAS